MAYLLWSMGKSMISQMKNNPENNVQIPNVNQPPIKFIFELPFEFRIGLAFAAVWIGCIAFDHITDILGRKYLWFTTVTGLAIIILALKHYVGIGPSSDDIISFFEEEKRERFDDVVEKNWKVITSTEELPRLAGKSVVLQYMSKQFGALYLSDEKRPYFSFAKKIDHATNFQLVGVPEQGVYTIALFSKSRRQFVTNNILGYLKVEANRVGSWEKFYLDFVSENGKLTDMFQLRSWSRDRHIMHMREGNIHKGFHDKFGEVAYFRMLYYSEEIDQSETEELTEYSAMESLGSDSDEMTSNATSRRSSVSNEPWKLVSSFAKLPVTNPIALEIVEEGFVKIEDDGQLSLVKHIEESSPFQICQIPNNKAVAFFSRKLQKYLSLSGIFSNKLKVEAVKLDNWERFLIQFHKEDDGLVYCIFKSCKTRPYPTITKKNFGNLTNKSVAQIRIYVNNCASL